MRSDKEPILQIIMKHTFKTIIAALIIFTTSLISCDKKEDKTESKKFTVTGNFLTPYNDTVFFFHGDKKDYAIVKNNTFKLEGTIDNVEEMCGHFFLKPFGSEVRVYLDNGDIKIDFEYIESKGPKPVKFLFAKKVEGSRNHKIWDNYRAFTLENNEKENYADLVVKNLKKNIDSFPNSPVHGSVLSVNSRDLLNATQIEEIKSIIDTSFMLSEDLSTTNNALKSKLSVQNGNTVKNFELENQNGETEKFYSPNNKFTIIDFWASWCSECRIENKELPELAKKHGDKLEIINISLDDNAEKWKKAIEKDGLIWNNYIAGDLKTEIKKHYGITAIPYKIFLDPKGKIIGINQSYKQIDAILEKE